ncbi:ABC transporter substrate-binding protein [Bosea caraganae]|uniref:ABC transporter substrate-binding protein n=1 Tax=Bosea caraganae TaxID=2763117 RepID=A0A370L1A7_9HYPH|nr:ABC transporter substrate-binding protein [Bosea caraganae]RDJ21298.1 ABC transporter substrate-binding protein [Bosea caraganae]RDJ26438.1 ABC transporter substrate-binding protein [Bosea caraganae]
MSETTEITSRGLTRRHLLATTGAAFGAASLSLPKAAMAQAAGTIEYGEAGAFSTFNPWAQVFTQFSTANQMFSRLVYKDAKGELVADLAESWTIAPDSTSITFKLRPNVTWHDGKPLTAQHFADMFGYLSNPALAGDQGVQKIKAVFAPVKSITAPDAATVLVTFSNPVPYGIDLLNYFYAVRLENPDDTIFMRSLPIGTGPFRMTEHVQGRYATFVANPKYHLPATPKVGTFRFNLYAQGSSVLNNVISGQVNGVLSSNDADLESLRSDKNLRIDQVPNSIWLLMVNVSKPPFDKLAVRQALSYSMNRKAFAEAAHFGFEKPVASPFYDPVATGYVAELVDAQAFDLAKAKKLLEEAGVDKLSITYPTPAANPNLATYAEIWQADLAKIGVTLRIQRVDDGRWRDLGAGKDKTCDVVPWVVGRCLMDSAIFFGANSLYRGANQRFGYVNPTIETLLKEGAVEIDPAKRRKIYQELNRITVEDCANISIMTSSHKFVWSQKVTGPATDLVANLAMGNAAIKA